MRHRVLLIVLAAAACAPADPPQHYGYVARLGRDTVSVENVTRRGNHLTIDGVDRFPRVRRRHTEVDLRPDGSVRRLSMDIRTPSEPANQRERHVDVNVSESSVSITKRDASGTLHKDFAVRDTLVVAHVPQMYSLYDLYFAAARKHVRSPKGDDTVHLRQFYVDREFDRFSMHNASVRLLPNSKAEIWHDWLAGTGEATLDSAGHLLSYSGARTTYKVDASRISDTANIEAIGARFASLEASGGGAKELSVRDVARGTIGDATFTVDYGRPLTRGRVLLGDVIPYDRVWRTGANAATQFMTPVPIALAGVKVPAGTYTLWTVPRANGSATLIVNRQSGQWGTEYDKALDLGMGRMKIDTLTTPVEKFTISIVSDGPNRGSLRMAWGTFQWTAPIVVGELKVAASR